MDSPRTGKQGLSDIQQMRSIRLPLNAMECGNIQFDLVEDAVKDLKLVVFDKKPRSTLFSTIYNYNISSASDIQSMKQYEFASELQDIKKLGNR
jgi:hypothetical protein